MKSVRMVVAVLLCMLLAGIALAENIAQQKTEGNAQSQPKQEGQSRKGNRPSVKGTQTKKKGAQKKKKGAQSGPTVFHMPKNYKIRKIEAGIRREFDTPAAREICSGFTFSEPEVREYFRKAYVISEHVRQHGFQTLPCYVGGEMLMNNEVAVWEIEASSAGKIRFKNGRVVHFGCLDACREMFDGK